MESSSGVRVTETRLPLSAQDGMGAPAGSRQTAKSPSKPIRRRAGSVGGETAVALKAAAPTAR